MTSLNKTFRDVQVSLTVNDVAFLFCSMDADEQAQFFNRAAEVFDERKNSWPMQLQYVQDSKELKVRGKSLMTLIGDYGA